MISVFLPAVDWSKIARILTMSDPWELISVSSNCAFPLSLTAHTQGDDLIGPITVIYLQHAFKLSAAADASLCAWNGNVKALSLPLFYFLSGLTLSEQPSIVWNGALIGLSYFHTGEYKWARKGLHAVALFDSLFSPPQSPSWPSEIFFHATSRSLSPNLLCSTWKETGYRSFGFLPPSIPSRSIHSLIRTPNPLHSMLSGEATVASETPWCHKSSFTAAWRAI